MQDVSRTAETGIDRQCLNSNPIPSLLTMVVVSASLAGHQHQLLPTRSEEELQCVVCFDALGQDDRLPETRIGGFLAQGSRDAHFWECGGTDEDHAIKHDNIHCWPSCATSEMVDRHLRWLSRTLASRKQNLAELERSAGALDDTPAADVTMQQSAGICVTNIQDEDERVFAEKFAAVFSVEDSGAYVDPLPDPCCIELMAQRGAYGNRCPTCRARPTREYVEAYRSWVDFKGRRFAMWRQAKHAQERERVFRGVFLDVVDSGENFGGTAASATRQDELLHPRAAASATRQDELLAYQLLAAHQLDGEDQDGTPGDVVVVEDRTAGDFPTSRGFFDGHWFRLQPLWLEEEGPRWSEEEPVVGQDQQRADGEDLGPLPLADGGSIPNPRAFDTPDEARTAAQDVDATTPRRRKRTFCNGGCGEGHFWFFKAPSGQSRSFPGNARDCPDGADPSGKGNLGHFLEKNPSGGIRKQNVWAYAYVHLHNKWERSYSIVA